MSDFPLHDWFTRFGLQTGKSSFCTLCLWSHTGVKMLHSKVCLCPTELTVDFLTKGITLVVAYSPKPILCFAMNATFTHWHPPTGTDAHQHHTFELLYLWTVKTRTQHQFFYKKKAEIWSRLTTDCVSIGFLSTWDKLVPKGNTRGISLQSWYMACSLHTTFSGCISGGGSKLCWEIKRSSYCCTGWNRTHK